MLDVNAKVPGKALQSLAGGGTAPCRAGEGFRYSVHSRTKQPLLLLP